MRNIRYDTIYQFAWWLCVVTLPWSIRLSNAAVILLVTVWLSEGNWSVKWTRLKKSNWVLPFLIFFAAHLIGLWNTSNILTGLSEIEKKAAFFLFPIVAASGKPIDTPFLDKLLRSFVYSCALLAIVSLTYTGYQYFNSPPEIGNFGERTNELFHHSNPNASVVWEYFSYTQVGSWIDIHPGYFSLYILFCLLILLYRQETKPGIDWRSVVAIFFFTFFLTLLASRMPIVAFAAILICMISWTLIKKRMITRIFLPVVVFIVLSALIWINPVSRFRLIQEPRLTGLEIQEKKTEWNSINIRLLEWQASWNIIRNYWLTGVGTGDAQEELKIYYASFHFAAYMYFNAHNQYFQTVIEIGLTGLLTLLCCFLWPVFRQDFSMLHISFVVIFGLLCLTECLLARQKGIVFFTLFQSLFLSSRPILSR